MVGHWVDHYHHDQLARDGSNDGRTNRNANDINGLEVMFTRLCRCNVVSGLIHNHRPQHEVDASKYHVARRPLE